MTVEVTYSSNNSGGSWWLSDTDWLALEQAGWDVAWVRDYADTRLAKGTDGRWLGALATSATRKGSNPSDVVAEWERITGQKASEEGCNCCGPPHSFNYTDEEGEYHYTTVEVTETRSVWV